MNRPAADPGLLAELLDAAPARIRRRLDAEPALADTWEWTAEGTGWSIAAGGETVTLRALTLTSADHAGCTCLLSPRCLHLLAVLSLLDAASVDLPSSPGPSEDPPAASERLVLNEAQLAAAGMAAEAGAGLLASGAQAAGSLLRADLLRTAYAAREASLPRLAAAASRIATGLRDLAADRPSFSLEQYAEDLAELLATTHRLGHQPTAADVGTARRSYEPIGPVRLYGLCTEPIVADSGYAGVVTYLTDEHSRLWTVSDVAPGGSERVTAAYRSAVRLGRLALNHHDLSRTGLFAQGVTVSGDGRLGGGDKADAARLPGARWDEEPLAGLWRTPLMQQFDRACDGAGPSAGSDLLFLDATVLGLAPDALLVAVEGIGAVRALAPARAGTSILHRLASLAGEPLRLIGRLHQSRPRTLTLVACDLDGSRLPAGELGRINVGLDALTGAAAVGRSARVLGGDPIVPSFDDPLAGLRRILHRVAMGGRVTIGTAGAAGLRAEAVRLRRTHLETAACLLDGLHQVATEVERTATGQSRPTPPQATALAWTTGMVYLEAARRTILRDAWT
jgi:hypothetical protein